MGSSLEVSIFQPLPNSLLVLKLISFRISKIILLKLSKIFLINKGVEVDEIKDKKYNITEQTDLFIKNKGQILACGTCLKSRKKEASKVCPISTMKDLLKLVEESDKVLTFG